MLQCARSLRCCASMLTRKCLRRSSMSCSKSAATRICATSSKGLCTRCGDAATRVKYERRSSYKRYQVVQRKARIGDRAAGKSWGIQLRGCQRCPGKKEMINLPGRWILNRDIRSSIMVRVVDRHDRPIRTIEQFARSEPGAGEG